MTSAISKSVTGIRLGLAISLLAFFAGACNDEEVDCNSVEVNLEQVLRDLQAAVLYADCSKIAPLFNKSIKLVKQGKNCEYVQNLVADEGYATVEEFVEFLETERDRIIDVLNC